MKGTVNGATIAPMLEPELKIPVARALSFFGNHSATVLMDAGKFPASPKPSTNRTTMKPITEVDNANVHGAAPKRPVIELAADTIPCTTGAAKGAETTPISGPHA